VAVAFRDGPFENIKVPLAWTAAVVVVVALIAAIVMIVGDRGAAAGRDGTGAVRAGFAAAAAPVGAVFAAPVRWTGAAGDHISSYFFAVSENRRLKAENAELRQWRDQAIAIKTINERYEALMGIQTDPPVPMATGVTVQDTRGPFARARLINVGADKSVRIGNPVLNEHGLIGRVVGTTAGVSRVLLLTDVASRTPVLIERTDQRALLTGDASANPRLAYIRGAGLKAGDRVLTSGDGGGFPRGLPVGIVARGVDGSWRVKLFSDRGAVDYVRVLLFQSFGQLADANALNAAPLAGLGSAPPPDATQAAAIRDASARRASASVAAAAARDRRIEAANAARPSRSQAQPQPASPTPDPQPPATTGAGQAPGAQG